MQSYNGFLKKIIKQLVRNFKGILKLNIVLDEAVSYKSFQTNRSKKQIPKRRKKKNPRWRTKSERPLAVSLTICEINEMHLWKSWKDHQRRQLKTIYLSTFWKCLWVFVRLCETKIGAKSKIVLHGYRQLYSRHENRRHLLSYCKIC